MKPTRDTDFIRRRAPTLWIIILIKLVLLKHIFILIKHSYPKHFILLILILLSTFTPT